jgi:uncharacterized protein YmfQ (DUF2313 family)
MTDKHIRRSGDDYAEPFAALLPTGPAWPREDDSTLMAFVLGLAQIWGNPVDSRAADLLEIETDPRYANEMLPDWERNFGLPDPCFFGEQTSLAQRHAILLLKMTLVGAQSRDFFIEFAAMLGYTIHITEYSPYICGISRVGNTSQQEIEAGGDGTHMRWQLGPPEIRFYWTIHVDTARLIWFRTGPIGGIVGVDPHLIIGRAEDLECLLNRWKPAHTLILFDYSGMQTGGSMAGTP